MIIIIPWKIINILYLLFLFWTQFINFLKLVLLQVYV